MILPQASAPIAATELPIPVARWLEAAWADGQYAIETITLSGSLRIRRARIRMPGHATMRFQLGQAYVSDLRIGVGPLTAVRGLDTYVDGTGLTRVGREVSIGPEIDQGAFLALWAQSILFPSAWSALAGLRWTPVADCRARVVLPFGRGRETVTLSFDTDGPGYPTAFEADRYRVVGGGRLGWRVDYADWHWRVGIAMPTRLVVTWADEPAPWFEMRLDDVVVNEPIGEHLDRAREAVAAARATGPGPGATTG